MYFQRVEGWSIPVVGHTSVTTAPLAMVWAPYTRPAPNVFGPVVMLVVISTCAGPKGKEGGGGGVCVGYV